MVCSGLMSRRYPIINLQSSIISDFMTGGCFLSEGQEDGRKKEYNKLEFEGVGFMWFWWFMLICDILIPVVMVIAGRMMWKHCPKHINGLLGYRTTRSMKNMDTWKFAHDYCGKLWWKIGWIMIMPSALIHIPLYHSDKNTIGFAGLILVAIQCFIMIVSIYPTEKALKKYFYNDGTRR